MGDLEWGAEIDWIGSDIKAGWSISRIETHCMQIASRMSRTYLLKVIFKVVYSLASQCLWFINFFLKFVHINWKDNDSILLQAKSNGQCEYMYLTVTVIYLLLCVCDMFVVHEKTVQFLKPQSSKALSYYLKTAQSTRNMISEALWRCFQRHLVWTLI